ncbi:MAG TPA: type II toxin-antitoxin system RelE/ParE family toxin [Acidimicrobiales bacterium]|nr:type II toxin-antitoxin system RelE/ParE family toxin [Acidimicrobiales bacterium]
MNQTARFIVLWHPGALLERDAIKDDRERVAIGDVIEKLEQIGRLPSPHSSAVQGKVGQGLRELRPRSGRSRWRPLYRQIDATTFVILAVGPEAQINRVGFDQAVSDAQQRFGELEL